MRRPVYYINNNMQILLEPAKNNKKKFTKKLAETTKNSRCNVFFNIFNDNY